MNNEYSRYPGVFIRFGAPNTPLCQGLWRRFNGGTLRETEQHFLPVAGIPQTLSQASPREASPTGKSGVGFTPASVQAQPIASSRTNTVVMTDTNAQDQTSTQIVTGVVNPWDSLNGIGRAPGGKAALGSKFTG